ncbi:uncharacterized protein LOC141685847 [Apium graveolens]|uniref:uncharacterized protein LOC141685847 n=1 Tax=Apium graveolens TaxID=4045 RepID=UPI003D7B0342
MCRVAVNNKIGHSITTPQSMIDQSVTPEQVNNIGHPMRTPLSRTDERVPPNISLRSSRGPSSFNTANVKSTFKKGESSRQKNLMNEFNNIDDNVTIDNDTTCGEDKTNNRINAVNGGRDTVNEKIVQSLLYMLDEHNSSASGRPNHIAPSNEVAGLIVTSLYAKGYRDTVIDSRVDGLQRIFETDPHFMQLQNPLLFPHGDMGYCREIPLNRPVKHSKRDIEVTESEDPDEKGLTPHLEGRLWQQYVVDAFTAIEQYRLDRIRDHQTTIRSNLYHNIKDTMQKGIKIHPILVKQSFSPLHSPDHMLKHMPGVDVADAPDVVARVFKMKVDQLIDIIKKKNYFGRCIGVMYVIEFQKRGLPHAHILIWLHPDDRPKITEQIDKMVSAEIPDPEIDPVGYNTVSNYMIHGPCGFDYTKSPCMVKGNCIKHFPKRYNSHTFFDECGFPIYKRRRTGNTINKKGVNLDNRFVVPFNRDLLVHFQCHMNLEICNNTRSLKYLFKYCLKGHDTTTMCLRKTRTGTSATIPKKAPKGPIDEVKHYLDGRYVCASEASWRIYAVDIHSRWPSVERLPIHLPGEKHVSFKAEDVFEDVCDKAISKKPS